MYTPILQTRKELHISCYKCFKWILWRNMKTVIFFIFTEQKQFRSSHRRCSVKKAVLKNFAKLTGKHLCQSLFFNKVAGVAYNFVEKETVAQVHRCFPVNFAKFLRTPFLQNTSARLFLTMIRNFLHPNICWSLARSYHQQQQKNKKRKAS